jgi:hypothetical protein
MLDWSRNPALEEELFARLRLKYIQDRTKEIHFSDTLYCLTKAYFNKVDPIPVDNTTLGFFAIGFALEEVLLREPPSIEKLEEVINVYSYVATPYESALAVHNLITKPTVEPYVYEGLHFSPDYFTTITAGEMDLKSTRMWSTDDGRPKITDERPYGFPSAWLKQFMGYAHRYGAQPADDQTPVDYVDYSVAILYLGPGQLIAGTIRFDWDKVELNMAEHLHRAAILEDQLAQGAPPTPFMYNEAWECKNCPYLNRCKGTV